jgi:chemotaxis protein MotB
MGKFKEDAKQPVPAWLVSFGDMMTLILTFFILLVSLAAQQDAGLVADGIGSFMVALNSHGLDGVMTDEEKLSIFNEYRRRFNLPPEKSLERRPQEMDDASDMELVKAQLAKALEPHDELTQPTIAVFDPDSAVLTSAAKNYLDRVADTLRPGLGQALSLEGHALDAAESFGRDNARLAVARAAAVRDYLVREHGFAPGRVEARGWLMEIDAAGPGTRAVDARLITPVPAARKH